MGMEHPSSVSVPEIPNYTDSFTFTMCLLGAFFFFFESSRPAEVLLRPSGTELDICFVEILKMILVTGSTDAQILLS